MNKRIPLGASLAMLLLVAALTFSITMIYARDDFNTRVSDLRKREAMYEKYSELDRVVRQEFVGNIRETRLMDNVAQGYLAGLDDKHAKYLSAEEYKKRVDEEQTDSVGIGAVVDIAPDDFYLVVNEVYADSPASYAGMQEGDLIIQIDDTELTRENSKQQLDALSGPAGSKLSLVYRRGSAEKRVELTRLAVVIPTVLYSRMLEDSTIAYMHIQKFGDRTYDQFNRELLAHMDAGATSLIIDLRGNEGGTLKTAARILDKLLPEGVLASATYKDGSIETLYTSDANQIDLPIVVLTNATTSSAAEIFAQSIKDFEKGSIVGATTAGNGVMLNLIKLSDGSAIELPVAYYTPKSGITFNNVGIKPDYEVALEDDWKIFVEFEEGDAQLQKAKQIATALEKSPGNSTESPSNSDSSKSSESSDSVSSESSGTPDNSESSSSSESSDESESSDSSDSSDDSETSDDDEDQSK